MTRTATTQTTTARRRVVRTVTGLLLGATTLANAASAAETLLNGEPIELSLRQGETKRLTIDVPAGATDLSIAISGDDGDADLYVRFGDKPTRRNYDCAPYQPGNDERCDFAAPETGTYHVMIDAYEAFDGLTLVAAFTAPAGSGGSAPVALPVVSRGAAPNDQDVVYAMWRRILEVEATCSSPSGTFVLQAQALARINHREDFDDVLVLCLTDADDPADCYTAGGSSYAKWEIDAEQPSMLGVVNTISFQHLDRVSDCDGTKTFYLNAMMEADNDGRDEILAFDPTSDTDVTAVFYPR